MKVNIKHILSLGVILLATSCMKEVDLEHLRPDPKLVLNCVASQGEPLKASLSRTWFYTDNYPNVTIENAKVNLYVNNHLVGEMNWLVTEGDYYSIGNYVSSYIPVSGDKVRIEAEKEGFREVMAEEIVPGKPTLTGFSVENIKSNTPYYSSDGRRYKITFRDNPSTGDCYLIKIPEDILNMRIILWVIMKKLLLTKGYMDGLRNILTIQLIRCLRIRFLFWIKLWGTTGCPVVVAGLSLMSCLTGKSIQ